MKNLSEKSEKTVKHFLRNCIYCMRREIIRKEIAENKKEKYRLIIQKLIKILFIGRRCNMNVSFIKTKC